MGMIESTLAYLSIVKYQICRANYQNASDKSKMMRAIMYKTILVKQLSFTVPKVLQA